GDRALVRRPRGFRGRARGIELVREHPRRALGGQRQVKALVVDLVGAKGVPEVVVAVAGELVELCVSRELLVARIERAEGDKRREHPDERGPGTNRQIGRASCRERGESTGGAGT